MVHLSFVCRVVIVVEMSVLSTPFAQETSLRRTLDTILRFLNDKVKQALSHILAFENNPSFSVVVLETVGLLFKIFNVPCQQTLKGSSLLE